MDTITVSVPARTDYISVLRSAVGGIGARLNFSIDDVEDLRLATAEVCSYLLRIAPAASLVRVEVEPAGGAVHVSASADDPLGRLPSDGIEQFITWHMLEALTDDARIEWTARGPVLRFTKGGIDPA